MQAQILPLIKPWSAGAQHQVTVDISGAPAGKILTVSLFLSTPKPDHALGNAQAVVTGTGTAAATFSVTLSTLGVNVLHCEVTHPTDFDSDSAGTVVT
jgi:hypothetical protein